jgi:hypothetical protein
VRNLIQRFSLTSRGGSWGRIGFLFSLVIIIPFGEVVAQSFSGRFVTSFYSYEQYDTANTSKLSLRGIEAMQLNFGTSDYQLHAYILGANDFSTKQPNDPILRAGNLYLEARNVGNVVNLKLGRQPVFEEVGVSSFDGLSANAKFLDDKINVEAFGGALPPVDEKFELIPDVRHNTLFGASASYSPLDNFKFGGAYVNKNFKPPSYYSYRLTDIHTTPNLGDSVYIDPSAIASQFVSGNAFYYSKRVSAYMRLDYDLNFDEFNRTEASFRFSPVTSLSVNFDYFHRDARLPYNSIFSVFDHSGTDEYDLGLNYAFVPEISAYASLSKIYYTGDNSTQFTVGTNIYIFSVNFSHNDGFAGNLNGINAQVIYPLIERKLILIASVSAEDYKILQESSLPSNRLYDGSLGLTFRPINLLSINLQGQYYQNPIYKNDFRGYLNVNYYFFRSLGSSEGAGQ